MRALALVLVLGMGCGSELGGGGDDGTGGPCRDGAVCACEGSVGDLCDPFGSDCPEGNVCDPIARGEHRCMATCSVGTSCGEVACVTVSRGVFGGCEEAPEGERPASAFANCAEDTDCDGGWICVREEVQGPFKLGFCRKPCASSLDCAGVEDDSCLSDLDTF